MQSIHKAAPTQAYPVVSTRLRSQTMVSLESCSTVILIHCTPVSFGTLPFGRTVPLDRSRVFLKEHAITWCWRAWTQSKKSTNCNITQ